MAIASAFKMEVKDIAQTWRVAEKKPLRSLLVKRAEDLRVCLNRAHHNGLYRTLMLPMRADLEERCQELMRMIFSDFQYLSPDEPEIVDSWIESTHEPLQELQSRGFVFFTIQDCREGVVGLPGKKKQLLENWTTGYYLLVLGHSCFSSGKNGKSPVHRFHEGCNAGVEIIHDWLRQEQDGKEVTLYLFANELMVNMGEQVEPRYCKLCFPNGPTGDQLTAEYMQRISGLSAEGVSSLLEQFTDEVGQLLKEGEGARDGL